MPSTYSSRLRLENIANGDLNGTWGDATDNNICTLLEEAVAGMASVTHSDAASYTLTASNAVADEARCMIIKVGGALTAQRNVVCPTASKVYLVFNNTSGGFAITFKTSAGTGVDIANAARAWVYCDGTNVLDGETAKALTTLSISGATSLTTPATGDLLPIYDLSTTTNKQITLENLFAIVTSLGNETAVDTADETYLYDVSVGAANKATVNNLFKAVSTFTAETAVDTADVLFLYDASATTADKATVNELFKAVSSFTAETSVDSADVLYLYDTSATSADKATVAELFKSLSTLTEDTTPDVANDLVVTYDASATAAKKVKLTNIPVAAATAAEIWTGTSTIKAVTPANAASSLNEVAVSDGATITIPFDSGFNFAVGTLGGNRTLAASGLGSGLIGRSGYIKLTQDGTGSRTLATSASTWKNINGEDIILSTAASSVDYVFYTILSATTVLLSIARAVA